MARLFTTMSGGSLPFRIAVVGREGHAARPHQAIDAIVAASHVVVALQSIVAREVDPAQPATSTVAKAKQAERYGIVTSRAAMRSHSHPGFDELVMAPDHICSSRERPQLRLRTLPGFRFRRLELVEHGNAGHRVAVDESCHEPIDDFRITNPATWGRGDSPSSAAIP